LESHILPIIVNLLTQNGRLILFDAAPGPCLTEVVISGKKERKRIWNLKEIMLSWLVNNWDKFSIWVTNQPTFVEVAWGVGLFYVALQIVKLLFKLFVLLFSPLLETPLRFKKQKNVRPGRRKQKKSPSDDDSPPFVFR